MLSQTNTYALIYSREENAALPTTHYLLHDLRKKRSILLYTLDTESETVDDYSFGDFCFLRSRSSACWHRT